VSEHRAVIEVGPGTIRRLCCGTGAAVDGRTSEIIDAALGAIDDLVALVGERPVAVDSLWRAALRSTSCARCNGMLLVHPSWWSSSLVGVLTAAAAAVAVDVLARPRAWLLQQASDAEPDVTVVVEIAERLVVLTGVEVVAVTRSAEPRFVAEEVAGVIAGMAAVVLIDTASRVSGASTLATLIAGAARRRGQTVVEINDFRLARLGRALSAQDEPAGRRCTARAAVRTRGRTLIGLGAAAIVVAATAPAVVTAGGPGTVAPKQVQTAPATFLVEGRVALTVPVNWPTQRVLSGPGSARVQVTSPSDPQVALHVTQSPVAGETLSGTAERLKRAIDGEPAGVFVDFNPSGTSAGRPAVTYREVRASHQVRWTVLLDGPVRISIGCQSRPGDEDPVRAACEQAVRSAHAVG